MPLEKKIGDFTYLMNVIETNNDITGRADSKLSFLLVSNGLIVSSLMFIITHAKMETEKLLSIGSTVVIILASILIIYNIISVRSMTKKYSSWEFKGKEEHDYSIFFKDWRSFNLKSTKEKFPDFGKLVDSAFQTSLITERRLSTFKHVLRFTIVLMIAFIALLIWFILV